MSFERYLFEVVYLGHDRVVKDRTWVERRLKNSKYEVQDSHAQRNQAYLFYFILTVSTSSIMQLEPFLCFTVFLLIMI